MAFTSSLHGPSTTVETKTLLPQNCQCGSPACLSRFVVPDLETRADDIRQDVEAGWDGAQPKMEPSETSGLTLPTPAKPEKQQRGLVRRILRFAIGLVGIVLLLVVLVNWALVPVVLPKTSEAWLNAPNIIIRSENEGYAQVQRDVGDTVERGDTIAILSNIGVDPARVARLRAEVAVDKAEQKKRCTDLQLAKRLEQLSRRELEQYRKALITSLQASLAEATAKVQEVAVTHDQSLRVMELNRRLVSSRAVSRDEFDKAAEAEVAAKNRLEQARASRQCIAIELDAAERNVFVQRDSPVYLTWHLQVRLSIPQIEAQLTETEERLAAAEAELKQIEEHTSRLAGSTIRSPISGVVWRRNASWGPVPKGETLLEIAETPRQFVEAQFPESHAASLFPGARAVILFSGFAPFEGTVRAVRQPSPSDHDWAYAIRLPRKLNQLKVIIDFANPPGDASLLGRQCQVLIADPSGAAYGWASKLFCFLRW